PGDGEVLHLPRRDHRLPEPLQPAAADPVPAPAVLAEDLADRDDRPRGADCRVPPERAERPRESADLPSRGGLGAPEGLPLEAPLREVLEAVVYAAHVQAVRTERVEPLPDDALRAAASDVDHEAAAGQRGERLCHAEVDEPRLLVPPDDLD